MVGGLVGDIAQAVGQHGNANGISTDTNMNAAPENQQIEAEKPVDAAQKAANQPQTNIQETQGAQEQTQPVEQVQPVEQQTAKPSIWAQTKQKAKDFGKQAITKGKEAYENAKKKKKEDEEDKKEDDGKSKFAEIFEGVSGAVNGFASNQGGTINPVDTSLQSASDERCKDVAETGLKAMDCYRNIGSYLFKYKPGVVEEHGGERGIDDEPHVGIIAQEIEENIPGVVHDDEDLGYKTVDARHLTMANTAAIGEIVRRLDKICNHLGIKEID